MNKLTSIQLLDMAIGTELGTAKEAEVEAYFHALGTLLSLRTRRSVPARKFPAYASR